VAALSGLMVTCALFLPQRMIKNPSHTSMTGIRSSIVATSAGAVDTSSDAAVAQSPTVASAATEQEKCSTSLHRRLPYALRLRE